MRVAETANELYLSIFVLFFRLSSSRWSQEMNAYKAVAGTSWVHLLLLFILAEGVQMLSSRRFFSGPWEVLIGSLAIFAVNYYDLIVRGRGTAFERDFAAFSRRKRWALLGFAAAVLASTFSVFLILTEEYHTFLQLGHS